jgi:carbon storage regulator CsrA
MLVLSRRPNQKILFPNLGISVEILRVDGKAVRIGVDAPREIRVLRDDIKDSHDSEHDVSTVLTRRRRHELRNRLNTASLGLQLLHQRLQRGETGHVEASIEKILQELYAADNELGGNSSREDGVPGPRGRRALVVEDNPNESELLAELLRISGYTVDTVHDGLQALSYLRQNDRPDAVLLDMGMPHLDGPATISSIRGEPCLRDLKLFAVSGADRIELGVTVGPQGVDRWFSKPVNASTLVRELNRVLDDAVVTV